MKEKLAQIGQKDSEICLNSRVAGLPEADLPPASLVPFTCLAHVSLAAIIPFLVNFSILP